MKILFLTSRLPYPPFRGDKLKIFNLIRGLSGSHQIMLLSFVQSREERRWIPELERYCRRVEVVEHPLIRSLLSCARAIPSNGPFQVAYFRSAKMGEQLKAALEDFHPDVIHTHLIRLAPYTRSLQKVPRVLDLTDAVSVYLRRFARATRNPVKKLFLLEEWRRMRAFEPVLTEFACSLVCSTPDRDALAERAPEARIEILENGVDLAAFMPDPSRDADPKTMICTGNMSYFPNADGIQFFVRDILPRIRAAVPDVRFLIVGQNPSRAIRSLHGDGITVTGAVPDLREYYLRSSVAVSPIRFGSGTLNKVLEPMALGLPVVATTVGVEGLSLIEGEHLLIGRTPEEFSAHVVHLLRNPSYARTMGEKARELIRNRYAWSTIAGKLEQYYRSVAPMHDHMVK